MDGICKGKRGLFKILLQWNHEKNLKYPLYKSENNGYNRQRCEGH